MNYNIAYVKSERDYKLSVMFILLTLVGYA